MNASGAVRRDPWGAARRALVARTGSRAALADIVMGALSDVSTICAMA